MRLLNVKTLQLEEFSNCYVAPKYTILSHTWGPPNEEISFQDLDNALNNKVDLTSIDWTDALRRSVEKPSLRDIFVNHPTKKVGWAKIEGACRQIANTTPQPDTQYIWIDTCCIDKSSSSELQEAINSMFSWYQHSQMCIIYLADVGAEIYPEEKGSSFRKARWFTRGWTLQELIAPNNRIFLNRDWDMIGYIYEGPHRPGNLTRLVCEMTGIIEPHLFDVSRASVAVRMSWAGHRQTSREEDLAYCLLGIFGIHMPMLYGEGGTRAFTRLQEEIMKMTDDCSLLSWGFDFQGRAEQAFSPDQPIDSGDGVSFLAPHPRCFGNSFVISTVGLRGFHQPSFSIAQRGLLMQLPVVADKMFDHVKYGVLACDFLGYLIAIPLISSKAIEITPDVTDYFNHWKKDRRESDRFLHEYIRPDYCRPYAVSKEFLNKAKEEQIVIRRVSGAWFKPEFMNLPVQIDCNCRVLTVYPPQPTGSARYLKCLKNYPSHNWDYSGGLELREERITLAEKVFHSEGGKIMLFVQSDTGRLLIAIEYRAIYYIKPYSVTGPEVRRWVHVLDAPPCQIFRFDHTQYFDLESLQNLASSWDFGNLAEVKLIATKIPNGNKYNETIFMFSSANSNDSIVYIKLLKNWRRDSRIVIQDKLDIDREKQAD